MTKAGMFSVASPTARPPVTRVKSEGVRQVKIDQANGDFGGGEISAEKIGCLHCNSLFFIGNGTAAA